ncbi:TPA: DMT family transporter [Candidatus Woesearchaeota archaeon]|nr:DMT family transporter [Candidatus Woesearchaeota archaeon]HII69553.1 DMT family transporter [Candidatus Woesearchaeota archaeon]
MHKKGLVLVLFTAIISGCSIFINSFGVAGFDSSVFTFSKNLVVAAMLAALLLLFGKWEEVKRLSRRQWMKLALIGFVGGSIPFLLFFRGLQMTTGTTSAFLHKTLFIYASVFALLFLKEKLSKGFIAGACLLLAGNYLMLGPSFDLSPGYLLIIGATVLWAAENAYARHTLSEMSGTIVAFGRMAFGSLFIFLFLLLAGKAPQLALMSPQQWEWIGVTSVFLLLYVYTFYNGLAAVKVSTATSILTLGAPITTLLDFAFLGKPVTPDTALGMLLIGAGVASIFLYAWAAGSVVGAAGEKKQDLV